MKNLLLLITVLMYFFIVNSTNAAAPVNDMFANHITISGSSGSVTGSNSDATLEPEEPHHVYSPLLGYPGFGSNSVWWTWTAPTTAIYGFDTRGTSSNVFVCIYTGDNLTNLKKNVYNYRFAPLYATNGTTYQIAVVGADVTSTGKIVLNFYKSEISPWICAMRNTNNVLMGAAAPNGSFASLNEKIIFGTEIRTNQYGYTYGTKQSLKFYAQSGVTISDKKKNIILNNDNPSGAGTQYVILAFNGKILTIYDQLNSRLVSYKIKKELILHNEQPLSIEGIFEPFRDRNSTIFIYQFQLGFPPNGISSGLDIFDIKLKKKSSGVPLQNGFINIHSQKKQIISHEIEGTYNLNINFFKKEKSVAKHKIHLPIKGQIIYCTDGKGGIIYWTREFGSSGYVNSPLSYISGKGKLIFSNKTLVDSGETWNYVEGSLKNFVTVIKNGTSATLHSYKISKEMKKVGEVVVNNYGNSKFIENEIIVNQRLSDQEGFTIFNSNLKKKWTEPLAPGFIENLGKGVFVRHVETPGAGFTNYHFKIFKKKKTIAEHDLIL